MKQTWTTLGFLLLGLIGWPSATVQATSLRALQALLRGLLAAGVVFGAALCVIPERLHALAPSVETAASHLLSIWQALPPGGQWLTLGLLAMSVGLPGLAILDFARDLTLLQIRTRKRLKLEASGLVGQTIDQGRPGTYDLEAALAALRAPGVMRRTSAPAGNARSKNRSRTAPAELTTSPIDPVMFAGSACLDLTDRTALRGSSPGKDVPMSLADLTTKSTRTVPPMKVNMELIGCPAAGKTGLLLAIIRQLFGLFTPSGLYFGGEPKKLAEAERQLVLRMQDLYRRQMQTTLDEPVIDYQISEGDSQRIAFQTHEACGQTLTETTSQSPPDQQTRYANLLTRLTGADVIWLVTAAPPVNPSTSDRLRFDHHLRMTLCYLQRALQQRTAQRPVSVATVITKLDSLFESAEEARQHVSDDYLQRIFQPVVQACRHSDRVKAAVFAPTTAFGWGNAELAEDEDDERDPLLGKEPAWLLREGAIIEPDNIGGLMAWTLLAGILPQEVTHHGRDEVVMAKVARMLSEDLAGYQSWLVPIKGKLA